MYMSSSASASEFIVTCAAGFEQLLAGELSSLSITNARPLRGQVSFVGTLADAYRVCMWSRIASRVIAVLAHIEAKDSDTLYASLNEMAWEEQLPLGATFAVDAHGTNTNLRNTQFVALRAKDAICDRCQAKLGGRPNVDVHNPQISVVVRLHAERATCGIDLSGTPLFRRGASAGSKDDGLGGMRSDYAAALLAAGGWYRYCRKDNPALVLLYSGSGALAVEALGAALDRAPGLYRMRWGFESWSGHDEDAWNEVARDAQLRAEAGSAHAGSLTLVAYDARPQAALALTYALRSAGITVEPRFASKADELAGALAGIAVENTLAVADLSWLGADEQAKEIALLNEMRSCMAQVGDGTSLVAFTPTTTLDQALGFEPEHVLETMLGRASATMRLYQTNAAAVAEGATVTLKDGSTVPVLVGASDQFAARLAKVAKLRAKWARKEDITCYRVYDADLPDYAAAIDLYQASEVARRADAGARWLVIQEYAAPKSVDAELAHKRLLDILAIAPHVLGVAPENVFVRVRSRAKGGSQYADGGKTKLTKRQEAPRTSRDIKQYRTAPGAHLIDEGGLTFEVNFNDRLDTGIFLDHRDVRAEVREMAKKTLGSKRFLNLFAYTGTATCYAADGGAIHTTTVDLSQTYLDWAQRNMAHNGFVGPEHEYVRADVVRWIRDERRTPHRWDLVFCDPPTFSNSKRMGRDVFDVQRDHAELLIGISRLLTRNGVCLFSCNLRGFVPDTEKLARAGVEIKDVTEGSIPEDFARNAKIHHAYLVRRTPRETV